MHAVKTTSTQAARFRDPFIASVSRRAAPTDGEAVLRVDSRVVGRQALSYLLEVAIRRVSVLSLADWISRSFRFFAAATTTRSISGSFAAISSLIICKYS